MSSKMRTKMKNSLTLEDMMDRIGNEWSQESVSRYAEEVASCELRVASDALGTRHSLLATLFALAIAAVLLLCFAAGEAMAQTNPNWAANANEVIINWENRNYRIRTYTYTRHGTGTPGDPYTYSWDLTNTTTGNTGNWRTFGDPGNLQGALNALAGRSGQNLNLTNRLWNDQQNRPPLPTDGGPWTVPAPVVGSSSYNIYDWNGSVATSAWAGQTNSSHNNNTQALTYTSGNNNSINNERGAQTYNFGNSFAKHGAGMLTWTNSSAGITQYNMPTFLGDGGTIHIASQSWLNTTGTASFAGGGSSPGLGRVHFSGTPNWGQGLNAGFTTSSVSSVGMTGAAITTPSTAWNAGAGSANRWNIGTLVGTGFNTTGVLNVSGNATLNNVTNINSEGFLGVYGTTQLGTTTTTDNVLNVRNGGQFVAGGVAGSTFTAGVNANTVAFINNVWGNSVFRTNNGTILGAGTGSYVVENVSATSHASNINLARTNVGQYIIGQNGEARLNVFNGDGAGNWSAGGTAGVVNTSGGNVIFGQNAAASGYGHVRGNGSQLNLTSTNDMIVGQAGRGRLDVYDSGLVHLSAANANLIVGQAGLGTMVSDHRTGQLNVTSGGEMRVDNGNVWFGQNHDSYGEGNINNGNPVLNMGGTGVHNMVVGRQGQGTMNVYNTGVVNNYATGRASYHSLLESPDSATPAPLQTAAGDFGWGHLLVGQSGERKDQRLPGSTVTGGSDNTGRLRIGLDNNDTANGVGTVNLSGGGDIIFGVDRNAFGEGFVHGTGSTLNNTASAATVGGNMIVGDRGHGELSITQGGRTNLSWDATFGRMATFDPSTTTDGFSTNPAGFGTVNMPSFQGNGYGFGLVDGSGSQLNVSRNLTVGDRGMGELIVINQGLAHAGGNAIFGNLNNHTNAAVVGLSGYTHNGFANVNQPTFMGNGYGFGLVSGNNSELRVDTNMTVGAQGMGELITINQGFTNVTGSAVFGETANWNGLAGFATYNATAPVNQPSFMGDGYGFGLVENARMNAGGDMTIGQSGMGELIVRSASTVNVFGNEIIGDNRNSAGVGGYQDLNDIRTEHPSFMGNGYGFQLVEDPGTRFNVIGNMTVGREGMGELVVWNLGHVNVTGNAIFGDESGDAAYRGNNNTVPGVGSWTPQNQPSFIGNGYGFALVSGAAGSDQSELNVAGDMTVGNRGTGELVILDGGHASVTGDAVFGKVQGNAARIHPLTPAPSVAPGPAYYQPSFVGNGYGYGLVSGGTFASITDLENDIVTGRSMFNVGDQATGTRSNLIVGEYGIGELIIRDNAKTTVFGDMILGKERQSGSGTGVSSYGYTLVEGSGFVVGASDPSVPTSPPIPLGRGAELEVIGNMIIGEKAGRPDLFLLPPPMQPRLPTEVDPDWYPGSLGWHAPGYPVLPTGSWDPSNPVIKPGWNDLPQVTVTDNITPGGPYTRTIQTWHPAALETDLSGKQIQVPLPTMTWLEPGSPAAQAFRGNGGNGGYWANGTRSMNRSILNTEENVDVNHNTYVHTWLADQGLPSKGWDTLSPTHGDSGQLAGGGEMHVLNGGRVHVKDGDVVLGKDVDHSIGGESRAIGLLHIHGPGSSFTVSDGDLVVGDWGDGRLEVLAGATLLVENTDPQTLLNPGGKPVGSVGNIIAGRQIGSDGDILVSGSWNRPPDGWMVPGSPNYGGGKPWAGGLDANGKPTGIFDQYGYGEKRSLLEIKGGGTLRVGVDGYGTLTVTDRGMVVVNGKLVVSNTTGSVYVDNQSVIDITPLTGYHTIAETPESFARYYINDTESHMRIHGSLVIGEFGYAGGLYEENRYSERFGGSSEFLRDGLGRPILALNLTAPYGVGTINEHPQLYALIAGKIDAYGNPLTFGLRDALGVVDPYDPRNPNNIYDAAFIAGDPADWFTAWESRVNFADYYMVGQAVAGGIIPQNGAHPLLSTYHKTYTGDNYGRAQEYRPDLYDPMTGLLTGNAPGLSITGGARVDSTDGVVGEKKSNTHIYAQKADFFTGSTTAAIALMTDAAALIEYNSTAAGSWTELDDALTRYYYPIEPTNAMGAAAGLTGIHGYTATTITGSMVFDYELFAAEYPLLQDPQYDLVGNPTNVDAVLLARAKGDPRYWTPNPSSVYKDHPTIADGTPGAPIDWMSVGYVVIDNRNATSVTDGTHSYKGRSTWTVYEDSTSAKYMVQADNHGHLRVGDEGIGVLRVINGALLHSQSASIGRGDEMGLVQVVGNESERAILSGNDFYRIDAEGNSQRLTMVADANGRVYTRTLNQKTEAFEYRWTERTQDPVTGVWGWDAPALTSAQMADLNAAGVYALDAYGKYIAATPWDYRSEWLNDGALIVGRGRREGYVDPTSGQLVLVQGTGEFWLEQTPGNWVSTYVDGTKLDAGTGLATLRIVDGGYVETNGLFIGAGALSQGVVSVVGRGSELVINQWNETGHFPLKPIVEGNNGLFTSSDFGFTQMNVGSELKVTMAEVSNGATLYLNNSMIDTTGLTMVTDARGNDRYYDPNDPIYAADGTTVIGYKEVVKYPYNGYRDRTPTVSSAGQQLTGTMVLYDTEFNPDTQKFSTATDLTAYPVLDTTTGQFKLVNARIVGNGAVGGEKGGMISQDPLDTRTSGQAYIDPGLVLPYDPHQKCDSELFYGTLIFGDTLTVNQARTVDGKVEKDTGVLTRFDTNHMMQDLIIVQRVSSPYVTDVFGNPVLVSGVPVLNPTSGNTISAAMGGTLMMHARASDYYSKPIDDGAGGYLRDSKGDIIEDLNTTRVLVMTNTNDPKSIAADHPFDPNKKNLGTVTSMFQEIELVPKRFFTTPDVLEDTLGQEVIVFDSNNPDHMALAASRGMYPVGHALHDPNNLLPRDGDQMLQLTMTLNTQAFSQGNTTYNSISVGKQLDNVYAYARKYDNGDGTFGDKDWLPVLRYFWYLNDDEFYAALSYFSGEVRAHSLRLPLQNVARFAHNRMSFRPCACCYPELFYLDLEGALDVDDPCAALRDISCKKELAKEIWERGKKLGKKVFFTNTDWWGSYIVEREKVSSDGNAQGYNITRDGIVVGGDRRFLHRKTGMTHKIGFLAAFDEGKLETYRAGAEAKDFNFGLYHSTKFRNKLRHWEWQNYLGMGIQSYKMHRTMAFSLKDEYCWLGHEPGHSCDDPYRNDGTMRSKFLGYAMAYNTEFARPFYFGRCDRWMVRPYIGVDVAGTWQNKAREYGEFPDATDEETARYTNLVGLDYFGAYDIKVYGRPGLTIRRDGPRGYLRGGVSYSYLMGGTPYTSVDNRFQYGGDKIDKFNIRGVSDAEFLNLDAGMGMFFGKDRRGTLWVDYMNRQGVRSYTHAFQVGAQAKF